MCTLIWLCCAWTDIFKRSQKRRGKRRARRSEMFSCLIQIEISSVLRDWYFWSDYVMMMISLIYSYLPGNDIWNLMAVLAWQLVTLFDSYRNFGWFICRCQSWAAWSMLDDIPLSLHLPSCTPQDDKISVTGRHRRLREPYCAKQPTLASARGIVKSLYKTLVLKSIRCHILYTQHWSVKLRNEK